MVQIKRKPSNLFGYFTFLTLGVLAHCLVNQCLRVDTPIQLSWHPVFAQIATTYHFNLDELLLPLSFTAMLGCYTLAILKLLGLSIKLTAK